MEKVEQVFERCGEHGIVLSEHKIQMGQKIHSREVLITPDSELLCDIRQFPARAI